MRGWGEARLPLVSQVDAVVSAPASENTVGLSPEDKGPRFHTTVCVCGLTGQTSCLVSILFGGPTRTS